MATITRSDGVQFVIQPYRELLNPARRTLLLQEIRMLAEQHGHYVSLERKHAGTIEATFSKAPGFLLAECVWEYFGCPENLIYCEEIPDSGQIFLVVIRENSVYLDARVQAIEARTELMPLMTGEHVYRIVTSGNVPLSDSVRPNCFTFPEKMILSFEKLKAPLFPVLPSDIRAQLESLPLALKSSLLGRDYAPYISAVLVCLLILGGWWLFAPTPKPRAAVAQRSTAPSVTDLSAYNVGLSSPSPAKQLTELSQVISRLYIIPGWQFEQVTLTQGTYHINVEREGGDMQSLTTWSAQNHFELELSGAGVKLGYKSVVPSRMPPQALYRSQQVLAILIDHLDRLLHEKSVLIGSSQTIGTMQKTDVTVNLHNISPSVLMLVGEEFGNLPLSLKSASVRLQTGGLLEGSIQLTVWGTKS